MRKLILFFSGLFLVALVFAMLVGVAIIYYSLDKTSVDAFFFQPGRTADLRPGTPEAIVDFDPDELRDLLIERFLTEYFYVNPDPKDIERRITKGSLLNRMSVGNVFDNWVADVVPELEELSKQGVLRLVKLIKAEPDNDKYWYVKYQLTTWRQPNNLSEVPQVTEGIMYMSLLFEPRLKDDTQSMSAERYLELGNDPAGVFYFYVGDIPKVIK